MNVTQTQQLRIADELLARCKKHIATDEQLLGDIEAWRKDMIESPFSMVLEWLIANLPTDPEKRLLDELQFQRGLIFDTRTFGLTHEQAFAFTKYLTDNEIWTKVADAPEYPPLTSIDAGAKMLLSKEKLVAAHAALTSIKEPKIDV